MVEKIRIVVAFGDWWKMGIDWEEQGEIFWRIAMF